MPRVTAIDNIGSFTITRTQAHTDIKHSIEDVMTVLLALLSYWTVISPIDVLRHIGVPASTVRTGGRLTRGKTAFSDFRMLLTEIDRLCKTSLLATFDRDMKASSKCQML